MGARTFVVGDIHGDTEAFDKVFGKLPPMTADDTIVFLGDYVDRGPDSKGSVERVWHLQRTSPAKIVTLRGNHDDMWGICWETPHLGCLTPRSNGCGDMVRPYTGRAPLGDDEELSRSELYEMMQVRNWLPEPTAKWFQKLPLWYEDDHAIYVHAGLDGEGDAWKHPRDSSPKPLLWMREQDFYLN